ncbi:MAG: lipopolysaccharide biosynthesis protein [Kiritimatiellae bacterium]|nr:lipopolysaccharide biosynthesis protein [Kiritimatiellia bacterium]
MKQRVVKGAVWATLEKLSMKVFTFIVTLVLARLLTPSDYGTVALLYIFTSIAGTLADAGFGRALVQKKDATEEDFNSVFYLSIVMAAVIYAAMFFSAPAIARFYDTPCLVGITRVMSLSLIFHAINGVQGAELSRKLLFDQGFKISLISALFSAVVGITLAYLGFGPWALVWNSIAAVVASTLAYWHFIAWRPKLMFSWKSVSELFSFGWKMSLSSLLDSFFSNLRGLCIGKFYTKADLAFVDKGQALPAVGMDVITGTIMKVSFPALAQLQNDKVKFRDAMRRMIQCSTFLVFPTMAGLAVLSDRLIPLLFGDQWVASVPYAQLACWTFSLYPLHVINLQAMTALGRSDLFLTLEIIKKLLSLAVLVLSVRQGVFFLMLMYALVSSPLSLVINSWPNRRLLGYTIMQQIKDVMPTVFVSILMCCALWMLRISLEFFGVWSCCGDWLLVPIVVMGILVFGSLVVMFKLSAAKEYMQLILSLPRFRNPFVLFLARRLGV